MCGAGETLRLLHSRVICVTFHMCHMSYVWCDMCRAGETLRLLHSRWLKLYDDLSKDQGVGLKWKQVPATHCNTLQDTAEVAGKQVAATHCNTLQDTAEVDRRRVIDGNCNTLQDTAEVAVHHPPAGTEIFHEALASVLRGKVELTQQELDKLNVPDLSYDRSCILRCVAVCCGVLRCVAVCCGVLRCVAVLKQSVDLA